MFVGMRRHVGIAHVSVSINEGRQLAVLRSTPERRLVFGDTSHPHRTRRNERERPLQTNKQTCRLRGTNGGGGSAVTSVVLEVLAQGDGSFDLVKSGVKRCGISLVDDCFSVRDFAVEHSFGPL